jgi:hypothetical protein
LRRDLNKGTSAPRRNTETPAPSALSFTKFVRARFSSTKSGRQARREVHELVSRTARGRPKEQIRAQLLAEYAKRGILPPPEPLLDNIVKLMITDDSSERTMLLREQREIGLELAHVVGGQLATLRRLFSELEETGDEGEEEVGR